MKSDQYHQDRSSGKKYRRKKCLKKQEYKEKKKQKQTSNIPKPETMFDVKKLPLPKQSEVATRWGLEWLVDREVFSYFHQAEPGRDREPGEVDGKIGADFIPFLPSGDAKPFQLKSTWKKHHARVINRHLRNHPHLRYVIVLGPGDIPESWADEVKIRQVAKIIFETLFSGNSFETFFDL